MANTAGNGGRPGRPSRIDWNEEFYRQIAQLVADGLSWRKIGERVGYDDSRLKQRFREMQQRFGPIETPSSPDNPDRVFREVRDEATVELKTFKPVKTLADALRAAEVDESVWIVDRWECKAWTSPLNVKRGQKKDTVNKRRFNPQTKQFETVPDEELRWRASRAAQQQQWLVSLKLKRKTPQLTSLEALLDEIRKKGTVKLPVYKHPKVAGGRRALEISIMDPHLGLRCYRPQADASWSLDEAEQAFMATAERLLQQAESYGPFEEIVAPIGNDFLHADNVWHQTTGGTPQPEMASMHETCVRGKKLLLWYTERLRRAAPVLRLKFVPGNHDRLVSFLMALVVEAFYQGAAAEEVTIDASPSPYKFWRYGVNLIGFEHGHSIPPIRLASLMANETRLDGWQEARYCEWHLGDQHRKGSSKPSVLEEQGVSVEYLPGLTPPNEWHRLKSYNWQKRGAMAFVYDREAGPIARLQVSFDNYSGKILGEAA